LKSWVKGIAESNASANVLVLPDHALPFVRGW
jgi:hypothetical protein